MLLPRGLFSFRAGDPPHHARTGGKQCFHAFVRWCPLS